MHSSSTGSLATLGCDRRHHAKSSTRAPRRAHPGGPDRVDTARPGNLDHTGQAGGDAMSEQDDFPERFHRDRREHAGASQRLDDDQLARLTEEERVAAGLDAYDPDEVPPATDTPPQPEDITQNEDWQEERAEVRREEDLGELGPPVD